MFKRYLFAAAGILMLTALCGAQQVSKRRLDAIWESVDARVSTQIDTWYDDGDFPKSIRLLVFQADYAPNDYDAVTNLAWMQENVQDWEGALTTYKLYRVNNPKDPDRALSEANYYFRQKQYDKVPPLLEPVMHERAHSNNFRILAHAYERLKRYSDAVRVWKLFLVREPNDEPAKLNLKRDLARANSSRSPKP